MTRSQRANAWAMLYLAAVTPLYVLRHARETRENWRNENMGRAPRKRGHQ